MNFVYGKIDGLYKYAEVKSFLDSSFNIQQDRIIMKVYLSKEDKYIFLHCYNDLKFYFPNILKYFNATLKSLNKKCKGRRIDLYYDNGEYQYKSLYSRFK